MKGFNIQFFFEILTFNFNWKISTWLVGAVHCGIFLKNMAEFYTGQIKVT